MEFIIRVFIESWNLLLDSAVYMLFGIAVGGMLKVFLSPNTVVRHLGKHRFLSVVKSALLGIPLPLCSCGVLPAAASLKKQGANNGATAAFLVSTPESGVDSIAVTYALLDPIMTIARPVAAMAAAVATGFMENIVNWKETGRVVAPDMSCPIDGCCDGVECDPKEHASHHSFLEKLSAGFRYTFGDLWGDLAGWFLIGLLLAGLITALVPDEFMTRFLGGGLGSMAVMLLVGIPLYICATASTPIAAALILKGVSPGAALVFLLAGPATNITSLTVLVGVLGKRSTIMYLLSVSVFAVAGGLLLDMLYSFLNLNPRAAIGQASELMPFGVELMSAFLLLALSVSPVVRSIRAKIHGSHSTCSDDCCASEGEKEFPVIKTIELSAAECAAPACTCSHGHEKH